MKHEVSRSIGVSVEAVLGILQTSVFAGCVVSAMRTPLAVFESHAAGEEATVDRRIDFTFEHTISMGLRSGEYGGRYTFSKRKKTRSLGAFAASKGDEPAHPYNLRRRCGRPRSRVRTRDTEFCAPHSRNGRRRTGTRASCGLHFL
jgi:hypothetical protein